MAASNMRVNTSLHAGRWEGREGIHREGSALAGATASVKNETLGTTCQQYGLKGSKPCQAIMQRQRGSMCCYCQFADKSSFFSFRLVAV